MIFAKNVGGKIRETYSVYFRRTIAKFEIISFKFCMSRNFKNAVSAATPGRTFLCKLQLITLTLINEAHSSILTDPRINSDSK